eukprot:1027319-Pyramimonas_sp.AAC.1
MLSGNRLPLEALRRPGARSRPREVKPRRGRVSHSKVRLPRAPNAVARDLSGASLAWAPRASCQRDRSAAL